MPECAIRGQIASHRKVESGLAVRHSDGWSFCGEDPTQHRAGFIKGSTASDEGDLVAARCNSHRNLGSFAPIPVGKLKRSDITS